jgi:folate-binding protein YgfZ
VSTNESAVATPTALRLTGNDALSLLHRISTQALLDLTPGHARATLFCDFRGRALHRATVAVTSDGAIWLLRPDAPGAELAAFLDRHIFRDDVTVEDRSDAIVLEETDATAVGVTFAEANGAPARVSDGGGATLLLRPRASGSALGGPSAEAERRRIRAGRARHGREIAEPFNPYEIGLAADVHLDKGCYTGQEALQRLITYSSVRRELVRVSGTGEAPAVPADVQYSGEKVGVLTSSVASEEPGHWIGLAVVKKTLAKGDAGALDLAGSAITLEPLPPACPPGLGEAHR